MSDRAPELIIAIVLALLVAGSVALSGGGGSGGSQDAGTTGAGAQETVSPARLARVERRVEELRGLRFERPVRVSLMSPQQVRRFGVAEEQEATTREQDAASEELMKLLGLIDPDVRMDAVTSSIYGEQVAGFYDPGSERLALVRGVGIDDVTLAHELTHALEDQHYDLSRLGEGGGSAGSDERSGRDDDAASAETGLVEGTATAVMTRYLQRYPDALTFGDALGQLWGATGSTPLPPYVMRSLLFPYESGEQFVDALYGAGSGWRLVDEALSRRAPVSTAELYDPARWLERQRPQSVALPRTDALGPGWRRLTGSTLGQFDLRELLRNGVGDAAAEQLAGTWEGGRYALWRQGPLPAAGCYAPCTRRDALALRLRFDSPAAAGAVGAALGTWLQNDRRATLAGDGTWTLPSHSAATVTTDGTQVTLTMAPTPRLAQRLAG